MPKPSAYVLQQQAKIKAEIQRRELFAIQQSKDMMLIALADEFGFGPDRLKRMSDRFDETFKTYAKLCVDDAKDDKRIDYTKGTVDKKLKQICGEYFVPWEERYS